MTATEKTQMILTTTRILFGQARRTVRHPQAAFSRRAPQQGRFRLCLSAPSPPGSSSLRPPFTIPRSSAPWGSSNDSKSTSSSWSSSSSSSSSSDPPPSQSKSMSRATVPLAGAPAHKLPLSSKRHSRRPFNTITSSTSTSWHSTSTSSLCWIKFRLSCTPCRCRTTRLLLTSTIRTPTFRFLRNTTSNITTSSHRIPLFPHLRRTAISNTVIIPYNNPATPNRYTTIHTRLWPSSMHRRKQAGATRLKITSRPSISTSISLLVPRKAPQRQTRSTA
mmetsp:Transcript_6418/g.17904  ORF Transcript_6418/g.17904 Transcript_6418/m.17904 type:complete len:277 (-) Transcript_6418:101-931(-)